MPIYHFTFQPLQLSTNTSITFVIPDVHAFQSGGNIYNKNLIAGLEQCGTTVKVLDLDGFRKKAIQQLQGYYFFDTLYFTQLEQIFTKKNKRASFWLIVHHLESLYPPKGWLSKDYLLQKEKPFLDQFDGFLTSSQFTADYLETNGLWQTKIVIPPAIAFKSTPIFTKNSTPIKALIVANLVERKGILPFLKVLCKSSLLKQNPSIQIHLAGSIDIENDYAQQCLALIATNDFLKKIIHYHGQLSSIQLHFYYKASNLFISTSFMETYGMALQEARTFHLPILALQGGNVGSHILHGSTGYLVTDLDNLVKQLENMVTFPDLLAHLQEYIHNNTPTFYNWEQAGIQLIHQLLPL